MALSLLAFQLCSVNSVPAPIIFSFGSAIPIAPIISFRWIMLEGITPNHLFVVKVSIERDGSKSTVSEKNQRNINNLGVGASSEALKADNPLSPFEQRRIEKEMNCLDHNKDKGPCMTSNPSKTEIFLKADGKMDCEKEKRSIIMTPSNQRNENNIGARSSVVIAPPSSSYLQALEIWHKREKSVSFRKRSGCFSEEQQEKPVNEENNNNTDKILLPIPISIEKEINMDKNEVSPSEEIHTENPETEMNEKQDDEKEKGNCLQRRKEKSVLSMKASRCRGVNGRGRRCKRTTRGGYTLCHIHLGNAETKSTSNIHINGAIKLVPPLKCEQEQQQQQRVQKEEIQREENSSTLTRKRKTKDWLVNDFIEYSSDRFIIESDDDNDLIDHKGTIPNKCNSNEVSCVVSPPPLKRRPSRQAKLNMRSNEDEDYVIQRNCGKCGRLGHNKKTCKRIKA